MSETKHGPEPWRISGTEYPVDANNNVVAQWDASREDARRIVACVNACAGIPTEELERLGTNGLLKALNGLALIDAAGMLRALGRLP